MHAFACTRLENGVVAVRMRNIALHGNCVPTADNDNFAIGNAFYWNLETKVPAFIK